MIHKGAAAAELPLQLKPRRPEAVALAVVLWASAIWVVSTAGPLDRFGTLKGTDFAPFYVSARLVATGRVGSLYDWSAFTREFESDVPAPKGVRYLPNYPPVLAMLLGPLGNVSYLSALSVWTGISVALYLVSGFSLVANVPALRRDLTTATLLLLAFPAFQQLVLYGQVSAIALMLLVLAWRGWTAGRPGLAGLALGALAYKPQLLTIAATAALLAPSLGLAAGIAAGIALEQGLVAIFLGTGPLVAYVEMFPRVMASLGAFEPKAEQIQSLRGFFLAFAGETTLSTVLFLASIPVVLLVAKRAHRTAPSPDVAFAAIVVSALLVNPHLYVYDLVVLLVPLALLTGWLVTTPARNRAVRHVAWATVLIYWLPLVAPALGLLRVQLMAPAMLWLLWSLRAVAPEPATGDR